MEHHLEAVWPSPSLDVREEVIRFWLGEDALRDRESAERRAPELLIVARDSTGQVAGVTTAVRTHVRQLGFKCFYYRTFVGSQHRTRGLRSTKLFWKMLHESYRVLNERFQSGYDPGVLGLFAEIESQSIMRAQKAAVWSQDGMNAVFVGRTPEGKHLRVWYFDGAKVP